jgi:hypothetical protein
MYRFRAWGLSAALAAGAGAPAVAADPPATPPAESRTLFGKLFAPKPAGPAARTGPVTAMRPPTVTAPLPPEILADALRAEQEAYLRRLTVCSELKRVAVETNDDALGRQADELERQATALYNARVAALGVPRVKAPLPEPTPAAVALDDPVSAKLTANRLTAPPAPAPIDRTAEAKAPATSSGQVREVKP